MLKRIGSEHLEDRWAVINGRPLFYRHADGTGGQPTLLHLHGFAISGSCMVPTADRLADTYRTLIPDLPGFGRSHNPERTLSIPQLADSAAALLDHLGIERVTTISNSMGGPVTLALAARHPDRVERAILVSPAGGYQNQPLPRAVGQMVLNAPREPLSIVGVAVPDYLRFGMVEALRLFAKMVAFPTLDTLVGLEIPTLVVLGGRDPLLPGWSRIREIAGQMAADHDIVVMKDAAHAINFSHPLELSAVIRQYLAGEPITGAAPGPGVSPVHHLGRGGAPAARRAAAVGASDRGREALRGG